MLVLIGYVNERVWRKSPDFGPFGFNGRVVEISSVIIIDGRTRVNRIARPSENIRNFKYITNGRRRIRSIVFEIRREAVFAIKTPRICFVRLYVYYNYL